jgi:hypothetical protein
MHERKKRWEDLIEFEKLKDSRCKSSVHVRPLAAGLESAA